MKIAGGTDDSDATLLGQRSTSSTSDDQQSPHHKWQKYFALLAVINITFIIVISVLIVFVVRRYEPPEQSNKTCMKCQTLSKMVEKRAWNGVSEDIHSDTCCFNNDRSLTSTLKHSFETRISNTLSETERLQDNDDQLYCSIWNHVLSDRNNTQSKPPYTQPDLSTLMQLINNVFNRNRSALYLTSLEIVIAEGSDPKISWESIIKKGHNSLSNDTCAVSVMTTGLYLVSLQVKFRANIMNNQTVNTTVQFFLGKLRENKLDYPGDYKEQCVFRKRNTEYDANLHTMARLETGDKLIVRIPKSQNSYIASERGAHRLSIFELS